MKRNMILVGAAAFVLAALALAAAYFYIPGGIRPSFDEGDIHISLNGNGSIQLDWPEAGPREAAQNTPEDPLVSEAAPYPEDAPEDMETPESAPSGIPAYYDVDVKGETGERLQKRLSSPGLLLEKFTLPLEIHIQAVTEGKNLLGMTRKLTSGKLVAKVDYVELKAPEAVGFPSPGRLSLSWTFAGGTPDLYEICTQEGGLSSPAASTNSKSLELKVGRDGDIVMPGYGQPLQIQVRAGVRGEGYVLCGPASNLITVERQDLLGDNLNLTYRETAPRVVALEWDETRGEFYELQEWSEEEGWTLLDTLEPAETFTYELGRLGSGSRHRLQVVAKDRNGTVRSSEEVEFFASIDPLYATIWPIIDQPFYEKADESSNSLGKIPGGTALCVLEEQGDWFQVRYKDQYGYVNSSFCMINLPEYVGDHCSYNITNSYQSIFKVHENPIALITDQVIAGFEHVDSAEGYLAPYLYPCSKKLLTAAQQAAADGYRLKIYEAFRPNEATRFLYDTTAAQLDLAALVYSYEDEEGNPLTGGDDVRILDPVTGWEVDLIDGMLIDPETDEKISREDLALREAEEAESPEEADPESELPSWYAPQDPVDFSGLQDFFILPEEGDEGGLQTAKPADVPDGSQEGEEAGDEAPVEYDTYFKIMTDNGRFRLGSFLAQVTSAHNRGIALDLTLEEIGGEELKMQSAIHDLSWYSATYLNNDNAKLLEKYMTGVGMRGLTSEWWHFQDDETREAIGLNGYLYKGVGLSGLVKDDQGWRCRDENGNFYQGGTTSTTIDGIKYTLDRDGYIME